MTTEDFYEITITASDGTTTTYFASGDLESGEIVALVLGHSH